jgi:hypothetical protein
MKLDRLLAAAFLAAALPAAAATPPSGMMANVYRLTEASAVLAICFGSAEFRALPSDRATGLRDLSARLGDLVQGIAGHYRDDSLFVTYENTRARIAADEKLKVQVMQRYGNCGEKLAVEMEKYVAENEALIGGYLKRQQALTK